MKFYWLVLGILGVWRLAHLFSKEDGPWDLIVRLRKIAGAGFWGDLLDCFFCLSLWFSIPFALLIGETIKEICFLWLALSAGASLLEKATNRRTEAPLPALYYESGESEDGLLRKEENDGNAANDRAVR